MSRPHDQRSRLAVTRRARVQDAGPPSGGRPQHEPAVPGDAAGVVAIVPLAHVGRPRDAVEPGLDPVAAPLQASEPRHHAIDAAPHAVTRADHRAQAAEGEHRLGSGGELHRERCDAPADAGRVVERLERESGQARRPRVAHREPRARRVIRHVAAPDLEVKVRTARAALARPSDALPGAHRKARGFRPQVLLVLAGRPLHRIHPRGDRLGERVEMPELEQPAIAGPHVERAPVPDARGAHPFDVAGERGAHRLADALAGAEVEARVEVTDPVLAEAAGHDQRRVERRVGERLVETRCTFRWRRRGPRRQRHHEEHRTGNPGGTPGHGISSRVAGLPPPGPRRRNATPTAWAWSVS